MIAAPPDQTFAPNTPQAVVAPPVAPAVALANAQDEARPVLPPRPTGRMQAAPRRSIWRNWPLIVIVLAVIAIAAAVVLMLWPQSKTANAESRMLAPPPAPERMDTNPMPTNPRMQPGTPGPSDPWSPPLGSITPQAPPPAPPPPDDDMIDPDDLAMDPFSSPRPGGRGGLTNPFGGASANDLMITVMKRACTRMQTCGNSSVASMCTMVEQLPSNPPPASCAAAQRCLDRVDQLDCNGGQLDDLSALTTLFSTLQDCTDALRC